MKLRYLDYLTCSFCENKVAGKCSRPRSSEEEKQQSRPLLCQATREEERRDGMRKGEKIRRDKKGI
jgi:hypothetical protein